jgi:hypothetical protein
MSLRVIIMVGAAVVLVAGCSKGESSPGPKDGSDSAISPAETQEIAEEAYIYAYPMMENYRTMYVQAIDRTAPAYIGPFNELHHMTELLGPQFKDVVRPNNDTMYSMAWIDLRAQPVVITVPSIENRYYSVQLIDMFTHNFAYMGTRATGGESGSYVVAGPQWAGTKPGDTREVFRSQSNFVYCIVRIEARGPDDVTTVNRLQEGFRLTPMHVFLGRSRAPAASGITFPSYDGEKVKSAKFIDLFNFLLAEVSIVPEEQSLMQRFAKIGVRPGAAAASLGLEAGVRNAVDAGVGRALVAINRGASDPASLEGVRVRVEHGWQGVDGLFGDADAMRAKYLVRAAAAMVGLYGNDTIEAYYPFGSGDASGEPLNGAQHDYVVRFEKGDMPPVEAFWSMTMYSLPEQLMVANPIGRYSIGDRTKLRYAKDGSLTIYIQHESPGKKLQSNWLPAPGGPFSLQFRMYLPKPEALDPLYLPPPVKSVR